MAIRISNPAKVQNQQDTQRTIIHELRKLIRTTEATAAGGATEATLLQVYSELGNATALLTGIETNQQDQTNLLIRANWTNVAGNSIEINYYAGVAAGNPSGSTSNIQTTVYKTGVTTIFTQTMTYNAANLITSVTTT